MSRLLLAALIAGAAVGSFPASAASVHPVFMAVVNSDGTIARANPASVTSSHLSTGIYQVDFPRDVTACQYQLTGGSATGGVPPVIIVSAASRAGDANGIFVSNTNLAGTNTDSSFHVVVSCP